MAEALDPGMDVAADLELADVAYRAGRLPEAESLCRKVLATDPKNPGANLLLAYVAGNTGRRDLGIQLTKVVLDENPNSAEALNWLASMLRDSGNVPGAVQVARRAINADPSSPSGHFTLGLCLLAQAKYVDAASSFERAIGLNPSFANYHFHHGLALERGEQLDAAARAYKQAATLAPHLPVAHINLGNVQRRQGDFNEAAESFRRALRLQSSAVGYLQLADTLVQDRRDREAEDAAREALALDPNLADAQELLGNLLEESGRFEEAAERFQKTVSLQPGKASAYYKIVRSRKIGDQDRPLLDRLSGLLRSAKTGPGEKRYLHYALGKAFDDLGEYEHAMRHLDEANGLSERLQFAGKQYPREQFRSSFDSIIKTFTPDFFARNAGVSTASDKPLFIVGMIRSGTTLVEQILSSHPKIGAGGELPFWLSSDANALLRTAQTNSLDIQKAKTTAAKYLDVLRAIDPDKERVTDKMPNNYMALGLMHLLFPNAKIIHCRRNPVDTCLSIYSTVFSDPPKFAYNRENIVFGYQQYARLMAHWRKVLPQDRFLEVDYEELVADREGVTRRMIGFIGLEWNDACSRHETNDRSVKTPSLWQVRQPIYGTSVQRWKHYEPWLGAFRKLTGTESSL